MRAITVAHMVQLRDRLGATMSEGEDSLHECAAAATKILTASPISENALSDLAPIHACALAVQLCNMALLSSCHGHIDGWLLPFVSPYAMKHRMPVIKLLGFTSVGTEDRPAFRWSLRQVAFCDGMAMPEVWTLSLLSDEQAGPAKLRGSCDEILDVWEGGSDASSDVAEMSRIRLTHGVEIYSPASGEHGWTTLERVVSRPVHWPTQQRIVLGTKTSRTVTVRARSDDDRDPFLGWLAHWPDPDVSTSGPLQKHDADRLNRLDHLTREKTIELPDHSCTIVDAEGFADVVVAVMNITTNEQVQIQWMCDVAPWRYGHKLVIVVDGMDNTGEHFEKFSKLMYSIYMAFRKLEVFPDVQYIPASSTNGDSFLEPPRDSSRYSGYQTVLEAIDGKMDQQGFA